MVVAIELDVIADIYERLQLQPLHGREAGADPQEASGLRHACRAPGASASARRKPCWKYERFEDET